MLYAAQVENWIHIETAVEVSLYSSPITSFRIR